MATLGLGQAIYEDVAIAAVDAAVVPAWIAVNGFSGLTPTRVGAGVYDLFFPAPVPVAETVCQITMREGPASEAKYLIAIDGSKVTVTVANLLGVPADLDFSLSVSSIFRLT